jgi:hypothetical protein
MDVVERIEEGLPPSVEELDAGGPWDISELWLLARAYSRLRHRSRTPDERHGWASLKDYCIRAAVACEPVLFVVASDPGMPSFQFVYHRAERNLLHIPTSFELDVRYDATRGHLRANARLCVYLRRSPPLLRMSEDPLERAPEYRTF